MTDTTAITQPNFYYTYVSATRSANVAEQTPVPVFDALLPQAANPAQLVGTVSLLLTAGALPPAATTMIVAAITSLPVGTPAIDKVRTAVYLTLSSPAGAVQK